MLQLSSRVAVVTGGAQGIGAVEARFLAQHGARVIIADIQEAPGEALAAELRRSGAEALFTRLDVTSPGDIERAFDLARETWGGVHILVANVGIPGPTAKLVDVSLDEWNKVLAVNLTGVFLCCKAAIPSMQQNGWGRIVIIGSASGKRPLPMRTPYTSTKLALVGLARTLALEVGADGITVNVISPYDVEGPRLDGVFERSAAALGIDKETVRREQIAQTALGRLVRPEDVAQVVLFLCSDGAEAITGQDLNVTAGAVMY